MTADYSQRLAMTTATVQRGSASPSEASKPRSAPSNGRVVTAFNKACAAVAKDKESFEAIAKVTAAFAGPAIPIIGGAFAVSLLTPFTWPVAVTILILGIGGALTLAATAGVLSLVFTAAAIFAKTFVSELISPSIPSREASLNAAFDELAQREDINFRLAVESRSEVKSWQDSHPVNFSHARTDNLVNYVKRMMTGKVFDQSVNAAVYKDFNDRAENLQPENQEKRKALINELKARLEKGEEVKRFIKCLNQQFQSAGEAAQDPNDQRNIGALVIACAPVFYGDLQVGFPLNPNHLVEFIIRNADEIFPDEAAMTAS
jgi:hypothetical protein